MTTAAIAIDKVSFSYGSLCALDDVSLEVPAGQIFGLLGPNGGGKSTLFRLMATLLPVQTGQILIDGNDVQKQPSQVRHVLGVTFQSPSLDGKLTVRENLMHQGHLYGMTGNRLKSQIDSVVGQLGLSDRLGQYVDSLSGGFKRRVEVAKSLLHEPKILLLDEPSTGLDPGARLDLWVCLRTLQKKGTTILVTTHLMDEAAKCDQLAILHQGKIVARGSPDELQHSVGGTSLTVKGHDADSLQKAIEDSGHTVRRIGEELRLESLEQPVDTLRDLMKAFASRIDSISLTKPSLEDVFVQRTGHLFWDADKKPEPAKSRR